MNKIVVNGWVINWARAELSKSNVTKPIEAKHLAILKLLAHAQGNIVSQQHMLDTVWENTVVSPNTIQQAITQLRKLFDDDGRNQKAIKTHPKLGYSLIYHAENNVEVTNTPKRDNVLPKAMLLLALLFFLPVIFLLIYRQVPASDITVKKITPITVQGEIVQSVAFNKATQDIYYLVKNNSLINNSEDRDYLQSLQKQRLDSANVKTLASNLNVYGAITLASNGKHLTYGKRSKHAASKKKCIQLSNFNLNTNIEKPLLPCGKYFEHSPTWLNNTYLVYLATDKNRNNRLFTLNTSTMVKKQLQLDTTHIEHYDVFDNNLAIIANGVLTVFSFTTGNNAFKQVYTKTLSLHFITAKVRWLTAEKLALINDDSIQTIMLNGKSNQLKLSGMQKINDILAISADNYLAILGQQNWSVRERLLTGNIDKNIGESNYLESKAKYSSESSDIYYLSNRSGLSQIWRHNNQGIQQVSNITSPVEDYISVFNDNALLFISNETLWLQAKGLAAVDLKLNLTPLRLYQANDQQVLLSAKVANEHQLLSLNLETQKWQTLLKREVNWAQNVSENTFITNNAIGQLEKYVDGQQANINSLPPLTLQWRYFWRADAKGNYALYFQDKNLNVWQFDPIADTAQVIGHYDINALFMTDYSAVKHSMLSDNFVAERQQLVQLQTTN